MNVSKVSRPSSILGVLTLQRLLYIQTCTGVDTCYKQLKDNRWFDLEHDHGDSGSKNNGRLTTSVSFLFLSLSLKLLLPLSSIYHQGFNNCQARRKGRQSTLMS